METAPSPSSHTQLAGINVLVVEDDYFVAKEVATFLSDQGARVLGPVPDVARGRALASSERLDCALLDVNLKGQFVFELAQELIDRGVPPIFTTGYDSSFLPPPLRETPCLQKPIDNRALVRAITDQAGRRKSPSA